MEPNTQLSTKPKKYTILLGIIGILLLAIFLNYLTSTRRVAEPTSIPENNIPAAKFITSDILVSPDGAHKIFVEKEFNSDVNEYTRQTLLVIDIKSGVSKKIIEQVFTPEDARVFYHNECQLDNSNFDIYLPKYWVTNDIFVTGVAFPGSECAGMASEDVAYTIEGIKLFSLASTLCSVGDTIIGISQEGNYIPQYTYFEFNPTTKQISKTRTEKASNGYRLWTSLSNEEIDQFQIFLKDCNQLRDTNKVNLYFN